MKAIIVFISSFWFALFGFVVSLTKEECGFPTWQRVECGWSGISATKCRSKGCCWDETIAGKIFCFKADEKEMKKGLIAQVNRYDHPFSPVTLADTEEMSTMKTCSVRREDRLECGWLPISRDVCEDRGCCFDGDSNDGPNCYLPGSLLIGSRIRTLLHCTWECSRTYWKRISGGYTRCGTSEPCWMRTVGQQVGICMKTCKVKHDFSKYLNNISSCVGLTTEDAMLTIEECATNLPCWVEYHGQRAFDCFKTFEERGKYPSIETSSENKEKPSRPSRYRPRIVPAEPEPTSRRGIPEESPEDRGIPAPRISKKTLRTSTNVERSIHNRPPINEEETEEEE